jgi:hypothetical protein
MNKEDNTRLLIKVATYMAEKGVVDISYLELKEIIEKLEENNQSQQKMDAKAETLGKSVIGADQLKSSPDTHSTKQQTKSEILKDYEQR